MGDTEDFDRVPPGRIPAQVATWVPGASSASCRMRNPNAVTAVAAGSRRRGSGRGRGAGWSRRRRPLAGLARSPPDAANRPKRATGTDARADAAHPHARMATAAPHASATAAPAGSATADANQTIPDRAFLQQQDIAFGAATPSEHQQGPHTELARAGRALAMTCGRSPTAPCSGSASGGARSGGDGHVQRLPVHGRPDRTRPPDRISQPWCSLH